MSNAFQLFATLLHNFPIIASKNSQIKLIMLNYQEYQFLKTQHDTMREERDRRAKELKEQQKHLAPMTARHDRLQAARDTLEADVKDKVAVSFFYFSPT